jgi:molecular chaperone GrpE
MRKKPHAQHPAAGAPPVLPGGEAVGAETGVLPGEGPLGDAGVGTPLPAVQAEAASAVRAVGGAAVDAAAQPVVDDIARLGREAAEMKERLLRTAADFDNFRKRAAREKSETWGRAQGDVIQRILEAIDDLGRVAHLDPAQTSAESLHEGVGLVERKLLKVLEGVGLERVDPSGQPFDPNAHEAVMTTPAPAAEQDGCVATVFQAGYRLGGVLLRPARVSVFAYVEPAPGEMVH